MVKLHKKRFGNRMGKLEWTERENNKDKNVVGVAIN